MKLWILYDDSPARLPLWVADSAVELAKLTGRSEATVRSVASRVKTGEFSNGRFASVEVEEGELQ